MEYENADLYHNLRLEEQKQKTQIVFDHLGKGYTLDVGCGTGISSSFFSNVMGIDPSETLLSKNPYPHVKGEAENLPFKDDEFENVIAITSIHNFNNIEKGLSEIRRVGKHFGLTVLKRSSKLEEIREKIHKLFEVQKEIDEGRDIIFICDK